MSQNRNDSNYERGVSDGQRGGFLDDFSQSLSNSGTPYDKGYSFGAQNRYNSDGERFHTYDNCGANDKKESASSSESFFCGGGGGGGDGASLSDSSGCGILVGLAAIIFAGIIGIGALFSTQSNKNQKENNPVYQSTTPSTYVAPSVSIPKNEKKTKTLESKHLKGYSSLRDSTNNSIYNESKNERVYIPLPPSIPKLEKSELSSIVKTLDIEEAEDGSLVAEIERGKYYKVDSEVLNRIKKEYNNGEEWIRTARRPRFLTERLFVKYSEDNLNTRINKTLTSNAEKLDSSKLPERLKTIQENRIIEKKEKEKREHEERIKEILNKRKSGERLSAAEKSFLYRFRSEVNDEEVFKNLLFE